MAQCFVYVADGGGRCKIGLSRDPAKRMGGLATGSAVRPTVAHMWALASRRDAQAMETALHRLFGWARVQREWFDRSAADIQSVGDLLSLGRPDEATELARMLRRLGRLEAAYRRRWKAAASRSRRPVGRPARRARLVDRTESCIAACRAKAIASGLIKDEWDLMSDAA